MHTLHSSRVRLWVITYGVRCPNLHQCDVIVEQNSHCETQKAGGGPARVFIRADHAYSAHLRRFLV